MARLFNWKSGSRTRSLSHLAGAVVRNLWLDHRGRHQAQGKDIPGGNDSRHWERGDPYPADTGHADLDGLEAGLGKAARERREKCFKLAHRFIRNAKNSGGVEQAFDRSTR
jgi:hypothetical protein